MAFVSGHRVDLRHGLLMLGKIGLMLTAIFLGLDWLKALPLSVTELTLLGLSLPAILLGALLAETVGLSVAGILIVLGRHHAHSASGAYAPGSDYRLERM